MKINVEVDCTPEEARRAMGLPDFTPVHDHYIGMLLWRQLFDLAGTTAKKG